MKLEITQGNLLEQNTDLIVNPAHVSGYMGYGAAKAIVQAGGKKIEEDAVHQAPLIIGDAIITSAGSLNFQGVVHACTVDDANLPTGSANISKATLGALLLADDQGYKSVAFPGMGTGIGGSSYENSAKAMKQAFKDFNPHVVERVVFVDLNPEMIEAWKKAK